MKHNKNISLITNVAAAFALAFTLYSCDKLKEMSAGDKFSGKIFYYYDDSTKLIAGFEKDTLYYVLRVKSPVSPMEVPVGHKSKYALNKTNDSTYVITLENKPRFWEKNTWEVVLRDPNTLYSVESGKIYLRTEDKSLLKK